MSIIRKVNDKPQVIAEKSVIDHNQLANRAQLNCHPISAIRKLPEKLTALKQKDEEINQDIEQINARIDTNTTNIANNAEKIASVENNTKKIDIIENDDSTFTFTNYGAQDSKTIQSGFLPDDDTLQLKTIDGKRKLAIKKVYTNNEDINGSGTSDSPLRLVNKPDELTLKTDVDNHIIYVSGLKDGEGSYTASAIKEDFADVNASIGAVKADEAKHYKELQQENNNQNNHITDLLSRTKGIGGYLNANNFESATPSQDELTNYALQQIGITDKTKIFNQTKVKNLFDGNIWVLTNTPDSTPSVFDWANVGQEKIADANNDGVHGLVTGSYDELQGSIDILGHIHINDLEPMVKTELKIRRAADGYYSEGSDGKLTVKGGFVSETYQPYSKQNISTNLLIGENALNPIINAHNNLVDKVEANKVSPATETVFGTVRMWKDNDGYWNISSIKDTPQVQLTSTYVINSSPATFEDEIKVFNINFTSNNQLFTGIEFHLLSKGEQYITYEGPVGSGLSGTTVYDSTRGNWLQGEKYRTITLASDPDSELNTWLSNNSTQLEPGLYSSDYTFQKSWDEIMQGKVFKEIKYDGGIDLQIDYTGNTDRQKWLANRNSVINFPILILPDNITSINATNPCEDGPFSETSLTTVILPNSLHTIGYVAFYNMAELVNLTIPVSVKEFTYNSQFGQSPKLTELKYAGSDAQWRAITKRDGWVPNASFDMVICTNGTVPLNS